MTDSPVRELVSIDDAKLITCIVPKGKAIQILEALKEQGINGANYHRARGVGRFSPLAARGIGEQQERDILEVTVRASRAEEIFEMIYRAGEMDRPHGGLLYMASAPRMTLMTVPDLPEPG